MISCLELVAADSMEVRGTETKSWLIEATIVGMLQVLQDNPELVEWLRRKPAE